MSMRKIFMIIALTAAFSGLGLVFHQGHAAAFYGCGVGYTYDPTHTGYFTGNKGSAPCNVLPYPALLNVNSTSSFFSYMDDYLNQKNNNRENLSTSQKWIAMVGAAFIIDRMLGYPGNSGLGNGINYARANFGVWKQRVLDINNDPSSGTGIDWGYKPSYDQFCGINGYPATTNSAYSPDIGDDVFYRTTCPWDYNHSLPEIKLFWPGGSFEIGKQCGNVELTFKALPVNHQPSGSLTLTCDTAAAQWVAKKVTIDDADAVSTTGYVTVFGTSWQSPISSSGNPATVPIPTTDAPPNSTVTVEVYAKDVGPAGTGKYIRVAYTATTPPCASYGCGNLSTAPGIVDPYMRFSVTVSVTSSGTPPSGDISIAIKPRAPNTFSANPAPVPATNGQATFTGIGPTSTAGDKSGGIYDVTWTLGATSCSGTIAIVNLPYVKVYGGDAMAGTSATYDGAASSCDVSDDVAGAYGWNNLDASYSGAGTEYAVMALGAINGFAPTQTSSNTKPLALAFANTYASGGAAKVNPAQGLFGGYFNDPNGTWSGSCDFTSDLTGAQVVNGSKTFGAQNVSSNNDVWYVKNGDVYISGKIAYASTTWSSPSQIPYFKLVVVGGDIYIDSSVQQLDGIYVSEPSTAGVGGHIYTCATGLGKDVRPDGTNVPGGSTYYKTCGKQLVINGAFIARQVWFARTFGTVGQAGSDTPSVNHVAEVFHYSPEVWLPRGTKAPADSYAGITGLPPIL